MNSLNKSRIYSWIALVLIVLGDVFALIAKSDNWSTWRICLICVLSLIFLLWIVGWLKQVKFGLKSIVLVKLLSNAAGPRPLSVLYLLLFVLHIGWLGNIFASSDHIVFSLFICVSLLIALILFFPGRQENKDENATKVFVSGISSINYNNLNMTPLVRILQKTDNDSACEMIILFSNYYSKISNQSWINDNIKRYYDEAYDNAIAQIQEESVKAHFESIKDGDNITEKMKLLVRIWAYQEFPEKKWILHPDNLRITFTPENDYDNFEQCFNIIDNILKEKDDSTHILYFNLTPGTANISALMTLMAIDGNRRLFYYIPENDPKKVREISEKEKELRLKEVIKKEMSLENLLSQAIETLNK